MTELEKNDISIIRYDAVVFSVLYSWQNFTEDQFEEDRCKLKLHYITKELCDLIISSPDKAIVVYRENDPDAWVLEMISRYLPIRKCILKQGEPEQSFLNRLIIERNKPLSNTFEKIKKFAKNNGLTYLNEKYFTQLKTKQLLFK